MLLKRAIWRCFLRILPRLPRETSELSEEKGGGFADKAENVVQGRPEAVWKTFQTLLDRLKEAQQRRLPVEERNPKISYMLWRRGDLQL